MTNVVPIGYRQLNGKKPRGAETPGARHRRVQLPCTPDLYTLLFTLAEAKAILADPVRDMAYLDTPLGPHVRDYLAWFRLGRRSPRTLDTYERILARLAVNLPADVGIADVDVTHLILMLDTVPEGSWKLHRAAYNGLFRWAIRHDRRNAKNPVDLLPELLAGGRARTAKTFTEQERELLVNAARHMDDPARDRARAYLLLDTGIRKGEAMGLRFHDVDAGRRTIEVTGKGRKHRVIPVRGPFWLAWEEALLEPLPRLGWPPEPDYHVWFPMRVAGAYQARERQVTASYPERPMSQRGFHEWWGRLCGHAGVPYRNLHMTRHTYATAVLDATEGDIYGVAELLGHASTKTTELYLHSSQLRKESAVEKYARAASAATSHKGGTRPPEGA